jgi:hypothetical protein
VKSFCSTASLRSPKNPLIRIEPAYDCDGSHCGLAASAEVELLADIPPHFHLIEWEPNTEFRCYAVWGSLSEHVYEPSH